MYFKRRAGLPLCFDSRFPADNIIVSRNVDVVLLRLSVILAPISAHSMTPMNHCDVRL